MYCIVLYCIRRRRTHVIIELRYGKCILGAAHDIICTI